MHADHSYHPEDAQISVAALDFLRTPAGAALRQRLAELPAGGSQPTVAQVARLRKEFPAEAVHASLALARLQPKAAGPKGKFPHLSYVWATPEALEQASHIDVGRHKAHRFFELGARHVYDLCAGIGGDALAFAEQMPVTAVELSPVRSRCLEYNVQEAARTGTNGASLQEIAVLTADVRATPLPADAWVHIDPARRSAGKRSPLYEDLIPGPDLVAQLFASGRRGAVKLSPAVDFESLPPGHVELISHQGATVQALLWLNTGLDAGQRTATVLARGQEPFSLTAQPWAVEIAPAPIAADIGGTRRTLYELDGAVTRAGLAQALAQRHHLVPLTTDGGYLLTDADHANTAGLHVLTPFDIWGIVPFSRVAEALRTLPVQAPGAVEVKSRGRLPGIDTDELQTRWSKLRHGACTVLLFRQDEQTLAAVGFRAGAHPAAPSPLV